MIEEKNLFKYFITKEDIILEGQYVENMRKTG